MPIQTKYRTEEEEIMDDFSLEGQELQEALDKIASINQLLGGNKLTLQGVEKLLQNKPQSIITVVDVGCGNGDMLRALADYAKLRNIQVQLIGIDANAFTINYAQKLSEDYPMISYQCEDIFSEYLAILHQAYSAIPQIDFDFVAIYVRLKIYISYFEF